MSRAFSAFRIAIGSVLISSAFVAAPAAARSEFTGDVARDLNMPCEPDCTLCHRTLAGGPGNLRFVKGTQDVPGFGFALKGDFGVDVSNRDSLGPALQAAEAAGSDVDGDGVPDITELKAGDDPNDPTAGARLCGSSAPEYGCLRVAPRGSVDSTGALAGIAVLLVGASRLHRRRLST